MAYLWRSQRPMRRAYEDRADYDRRVRVVARYPHDPLLQFLLRCWTGQDVYPKFSCQYSRDDQNALPHGGVLQIIVCRTRFRRPVSPSRNIGHGRPERRTSQPFEPKSRCFGRHLLDVEGPHGHKTDPASRDRAQRQAPERQRFMGKLSSNSHANSGMHPY